MKDIFYIIIILVFTGSSITAQEALPSVSEADFKNIEQEIDYSDTKRVLTRRTPRKPREIKDISEPNVPNVNFSGLGSILNIIAMVLIGILVLMVLYAIFSNYVLKPRREGQKNLGQIEEEHIEEIDLEKSFDSAIAKGDLRSALRVRFLKVLQSLSIEKAIVWRPEKTNRDYALELKGSTYYQSYKHLSHIFEYVWYGNEEITEEIFQSCLSEFDRFNIEDL